MINFQIVKIYKFLETIKSEKIGFKTRVKALKNSKEIEKQIELIKEVEKDMLPTELEERLNEFTEKRNELISSNKLEDKRLSETPEDIIKKFKELENEYSKDFKIRDKAIQEHNEFLLEEVGEFKFEKFDLYELEKIEIDNSYDDVIEYLVDMK